MENKILEVEIFVMHICFLVSEFYHRTKCVARDIGELGQNP